MIYITVLCIEDQVSRLCVFYWNLGPILALILGNTRKIISVSLVNLLYKSGTVCSVCQTGSAPHIRITDKLGCIFNHWLADFTTRRSFFCRSQRIVKSFIIFRIHVFLCHWIGISSSFCHLCFGFSVWFQILLFRKTSDISGFYINPVWIFICENVAELSCCHCPNNSGIRILLFLNIQGSFFIGI